MYSGTSTRSLRTIVRTELASFPVRALNTRVVFINPKVAKTRFFHLDFNKQQIGRFMRVVLTNSVALFLMFLLVAQTALLTVTNDVNIAMLTSETNGEDSFSVSARNGSSWGTPVTLDNSTYEIGRQSSLAIDSNDNLHVTYFDSRNGNLEYMTYSDSTWTAAVTLDSRDNVGQPSSLAIDSNDHLHVTYLDATNQNLEYMTYDGSSWSTPVSLDSIGDDGGQSSLAIDSNDNLHVIYLTYIDSTNYNLDYMTYTNSSWSTPASLDSTDWVGFDPSLAIDSNDNLHVTYLAYYNLEYMTYNGSSWSTPVSIDSTDDVGPFSSLAIDSNDHLHVTYLDASNANLEYMTYDGSSWSTPVTLDNSTGERGEESSLAVDSNDNLHVTYLDGTNGSLNYMIYDGSSWSTPVTLDTKDATGRDSSLAIDSNDDLHVTYLATIIGAQNIVSNLAYVTTGNNTGNTTANNNDAIVCEFSGVNYEPTTEVIFYLSWTDSIGDEHCGTVQFELYSAEAPIHVQNFQDHVEAGNYNGTVYHRIIDGFMIQSGDFEYGNGMGGYAYSWHGYCAGQQVNQVDCDENQYSIPDESNSNYVHEPGALSMAKTSQANTGGSQFFIVDAGSIPSHLNGVHTIFGQAIAGTIDGVEVTGIEVVDAISQVEVEGAQGSTPTHDVTIIGAENIVSNQTIDEEQVPIPSIGIIGTVVAISAGLFITIRREDEE